MRAKNSRRLSHGEGSGGSYNSVRFKYRSVTKFSQQIIKGNPPCASLGEGNGIILKPTREHCVFLNKVCPQQKLVNQSLNLLGYYHSLTNQREEKYLTSVSSSLPHGRRELSNFNGFQGKTKKHIKFTVFMTGIGSLKV